MATARRTTTAKPAALSVTGARNFADTPKLDQAVYGQTGLPAWSGRIYDEQLRELVGDRGRQTYREMSEQDPIIGGIMLGVEWLSRQVAWSIKPADDTKRAETVAEFMDEALSDMSPSFGSTLSEILSMLVYGWSWLEILYKKREGFDLSNELKSSRFDDGKVGWAGWSIRPQTTLDSWEWGGVRYANATEGPLTAMWQMGEPDFQWRRIPRAKSLHFVTRSRRENPEGASLLRNAYRPWYMKKNIEVIEGVGVERDLAGLPVLWAPQELFSVSATEPQKQLFAQLQKIVTSIKRDEQEGILMPMAYDDDGKNPLYKLELLSTGGDRQFDTSGIIDRYDTRIAQSMLADFILMGHQSTGSYALSTTKTGLFSTALTAILDIIADEINAQAFTKLTVLNGWPLKATPTLTHGKVDTADISKLADYLNQLSAAGMTIFPNVPLEKYLLETAGLPGGAEIEEAGVWPIDPLTGLPVPPDPMTGLPTDPNAPPQIGPGVPAPGAKSVTAPKPDAGARTPVPRDTARPREVQRIATKGKKPPAAAGERKGSHFIPLPVRVAKIQAALYEALEPSAYAELLIDAARLGKFSLLRPEQQDAIRAAEADPVQDPEAQS